MRVLEHQARLAAGHAAPAPAPADPQRKMPLIVAVSEAGPKLPPVRRRRRAKPTLTQPDLEGL